MFVLKNVKYKNILDIPQLIIPYEKIICIIGESGSGKTTLLRLLNNLIKSDEGSIFYKEKSIYEMDAVSLRRKVVMLPQSPITFPGTVKENLLIGLRFSEKPLVADEKLKIILEQVSVSKALTENSQYLSGGEKQRLALARVLLMEPEVLLLDEPSSALDKETEEIVINKLVNYCTQTGKALIMVTHSKEIADAYGQVIIRFKNGRITELKELSDGKNN